jgi:hypothetical protein
VSERIIGRETECDWPDCTASVQWRTQRTVLIVGFATDDIAVPPGAWMRVGSPADRTDDFCPEHAKAIGVKPWSSWWVPAVA